MCLPRTRGFTVATTECALVVAVSSPYAGVHRWCWLTVAAWCRVFPVRGGSPVGRTCAAILSMQCLPHTRGFTLGERLSRIERQSCVFPVRGGSPHHDRRVRLWIVSSPCAGVHRHFAQHARLAGSVFPVRGGSPARTDEFRPRACRVFPVRGGSPGCSWFVELVVVVSSPYAGVHRRIGRSRPCSMACLPRTRGFTADHRLPVDVPMSVFPVRGGSPGRRVQVQPDMVSSPYAGVHRTTGGSYGPALCLPRRGGSPWWLTEA